MEYGHWAIDYEFNPEDFFGFIYEIEHVRTGKKYIGKKFFRHKRTPTKADRSRIKESDWKTYTSSSDEVNQLIKTEGPSSFKFTIILLCAGKCQLSYEENRLQFVHDVLRALLPNGDRAYFNKNIGNKHFGGLAKQTEESKARIGAAAKLRNTGKVAWNKGLRATPEAIELNRFTKFGSVHTPETIEKMRVSHAGKTPTPEVIAAAKQANTGAKRSPECRARIRAGIIASYNKRRLAACQNQSQP